MSVVKSIHPTAAKYPSVMINVSSQQDDTSNNNSSSNNNTTTNDDYLSPHHWVDTETGMTPLQYVGRYRA